MDCFAITNYRGTERSWLQTFANQVKQCSPYTSMSTTTMFTTHKEISSWLSHDFVTSQYNLSSSPLDEWSFLAMLAHVMSDVFQRNIDEAAHDNRILSCIGRTFLELHFLNKWWMRTQREQTIVESVKAADLSSTHLVQCSRWICRNANVELS